jgi:hypothetical protein
MPDKEKDPLSVEFNFQVGGTASVPKRVYVFSTVVLLGLMAVCKYGSVNSTFKAMSKKWKQLFVFMVNYNGLDSRNCQLQFKLRKLVLWRLLELFLILEQTRPC